MPASAAVSANAVEHDATDQKRELEQRANEARESIANTVTDIKDAIADDYQSIKQGISDTLDWREQFRKHPVAWMIGAVSVGYVLGNSISSAYRGTKQDDELLLYLAKLGEKFTSELSRQGMSILAPALTGTILVPILTSQLQEAFGIDLSDLPKQLLAEMETVKTKKGKSKKKNRKRLKKTSKSKGTKSQ